MKIELPGPPKAKGRHRQRVAYTKAGAPYVHNYPDPDTAKYEARLAQVAAYQMGNMPPLTAPLEVVVTAVFEPPASWSGADRQKAIGGWLRPAVRPDWDNLGKICDALNGIVWRDDALIVSGRVEKWYGDEPLLRTEVWKFSSELW